MDISHAHKRKWCEVRFPPIGGAIIAIEVPDRAGSFENVVLA
jgi:hypothetical protein